MKKPFRNTDLSEIKCKRCGKRLKKNLIAKNPDADLCWSCWSGKDRRRPQ